MEADSTSHINRIVFEFDTLLGVADRVKKVWVDRIRGKTTEKRVRGLSRIQKDKDLLQTTISTKQQDMKIAEKTLRAVEMKLSEVKSKLKRMENELRSTDEKIQKKERDWKAREKEHNSLKTDQDDLLTYLDREIANLKGEYEELASKYWALRFLLREEILLLPEAKIIRVLQGKKSSSLQQLQDETYLTRFRVEKVVEQLAQRGLLRLESEGDTITILKPLKFEA